MIFMLDISRVLYSGCEPTHTSGEGNHIVGKPWKTPLHMGRDHGKRGAIIGSPCKFPSSHYFRTWTNGGFHNWRSPKWLVFVRELPTKMDENWGHPYFRKPPNKATESESHEFDSLIRFSLKYQADTTIADMGVFGNIGYQTYPKTPRKPSFSCCSYLHSFWVGISYHTLPPMLLPMRTFSDRAAAISLRSVEMTLPTWALDYPPLEASSGGSGADGPRFR